MITELLCCLIFAVVIVVNWNLAHMCNMMDIIFSKQETMRKTLESIEEKLNKKD